MVVKSKKNIVYYVLYIKGKARVVNEAEWERSWLSWYKRTNKE